MWVNLFQDQETWKKISKSQFYYFYFLQVSFFLFISFPNGLIAEIKKNDFDKTGSIQVSKVISGAFDFLHTRESLLIFVIFFGCVFYRFFISVYLFLLISKVLSFLFPKLINSGHGHASYDADDFFDVINMIFIKFREKQLILDEPSFTFSLIAGISFALGRIVLNYRIGSIILLYVGSFAFYSIADSIRTSLISRHRTENTKLQLEDLHLGGIFIALSLISFGYLNIF